MQKNLEMVGGVSYTAEEIELVKSYNRLLILRIHPLKAQHW
jgi:hypothetical protein